MLNVYMDDNCQCSLRSMHRCRTDQYPHFVHARDAIPLISTQQKNERNCLQLPDTVGDNVDLGTMAELDTKQSIELGLKAELADLSVLQLQRRAEQNGVCGPGAIWVSECSLWLSTAPADDNFRR